MNPPDHPAYGVLIVGIIAAVIIAVATFATTATCAGKASGPRLGSVLIAGCP